jgi:predicted dehydrogenase
MFLSWEEALERSDVDACIISTENGTHEEYAKYDN